MVLPVAIRAAFNFVSIPEVEQKHIDINDKGPP